MRCERLIKGSSFLLLLLSAACSREQPAPAAPEPAPVTTTVTAASPAPATPIAAPAYEKAMTWFQTTPGFRFVVDESGTHAEGRMERRHVGGELVVMTLGGEEWRAEAGAKGLTWTKAGKVVAPPELGNRLYQRVTLAFDPEKREGQAQLVEPSHYRFTDANSGAVHDVWVNDAGQITRMTIGNTYSLSLSDQR